MEKKDWHPFTRIKEDKRIEWCPKDGQVRAMRKDEGVWYYGHASNAFCVEMIGDRLLRGAK